MFIKVSDQTTVKVFPNHWFKVIYLHFWGQSCKKNYYDPGGTIILQKTILIKKINLSTFLVI